MYVIVMMHEINLAANPMIGESALPDPALSTDDTAEIMRVRAFNQLNSPLDCYVDLRSQQEMNMIGHYDKRMQLISALASMPIKGLQEESNVRFDNEQFPTLPRREGYEIRSRRGDEPSRLQEQTSAAESRTSLQTLNWHEWNSCPSRLFLL